MLGPPLSNTLRDIAIGIPVHVSFLPVPVHPLLFSSSIPSVCPSPINVLLNLRDLGIAVNFLRGHGRGQSPNLSLVHLEVKLIFRDRPIKTRKPLFTKRTATTE